MRFCWYLQLRGSSFCRHKTMPAASHNQWHTSSCALDFQNISSRFYKTSRTFTIRASLFPALYYITSCIRGMYQIIFFMWIHINKYNFCGKPLGNINFWWRLRCLPNMRTSLSKSGRTRHLWNDYKSGYKSWKISSFSFFQFFNHCKILKVKNIFKVPWIALRCIIFQVFFYMFVC